MVGTLANLVPKYVNDDLSSDEEEDAEKNVAERPSILQRIRYQNELHDDVYEEEDCVDQEQNDEKTRRVRRTQASLILKSQKASCQEKSS